MQQDFRVKSGIILSGNITGAQNITVTYSGSFGNLFVSGKVYGNVEGTVSTLSNFTTANLAENNSALYYTNARVVSAVNPLLTTANVVEKDNLYFTQERVTPQLTTANVVETTNQYFTNVRVLQAVDPKLNTANVVETTNQYFTNVRVLQAVDPKLTTANVIEKDNLYFTAQRAIDALAGNNVTVNNLTVSGDLEIQGNTVSVNTATLTIEDKNIIIANGAINYAQADGAGITIAGANATITYVSAGDELQINKDITAQANISVAGTLDVVGNVNLDNPAFIDGDPVITLNPLNQSIALLRSQMDAQVGNVLYVAGNGNDNNSGNSIANALANIHTALNRAQPWTTVFVKSGDYILYEQPVTIKRRVGMVGDNLRTTTIRPSNVVCDMFYVNNACYVTGITFRDHQHPAAVFSFNPNGSAGVISTSPYIQNCSSITTTGTGMRVDGRYVQGLRSMVCDAYTQTNAGGIGIHMLNQGYTQLVSVFTICCDIAILCENGGFCSITNSNSSFGNYGLVARGVSQMTNFGKLESVTDDGFQTYYNMVDLAERPSYGDAVAFANYDQAKCERDTGLIVDSLAVDLAYQSNTQSAFAGLQYWAQQESAIPNQATETIAAFTYAKNLATNVAANITITAPRQANVVQVRGTPGAWVSRVADGFELVANIITGGTLGITDRIIPNSFPANTNVAVNDAANLIISNKEFIQKEVIAYVNQEYPGFFANTANFISGANAITKCERDTGYLIDSIVFDFLHGGNRQAVTSGVYYYNNDFETTQITGQIPQTTAAYDFIGTIIEKIVKNKKIGRYDQEKCERDTGLIVDSLLIDLAYGSNTQSVFSGLQYWSQSESAIQNQSAETIAAINLAKRLATNVAANIAITSTYQANVAQVRGLPGTQISRVASEFDLIVDIINNGTVGVTDRIIPNTYPANSDVTAHHTANLLVLNKDFIAAEVIAYVNQTYPGFFANANNFVAPLTAANTCSRDVGYILDSVAFDIRHDGNRQAIQSGVYYYNYNANVTQINDQVVQTGLAYDFIGRIIGDVVKNKKFASYNQEKCERDTGLIVDSIALDLLYQGNTQATFAGLQYWAQSTSAIPNQSVETLAAINFVKNTAANIMTGTYAGDYQNNVSFTSGATDGTGYAASILNARIDLVANIIQGGTVGVTDRIISNGLYNTSNVNLTTAANIIVANKDFIAAETIGFVNQTYPGFFANASNFIDPANAITTCSRDVGYILDSVIFDVLHGGNKQSVQAGTYYYNHNANVTQINDQVVKTGRAYTFVANLIDALIANTTVTSLYQTDVTQNLSNQAGTDAETVKTYQSVNLINNIITNGPSVAPAKAPISLIASNNSNVRNAANIIIANRAFITAETVAYINQTQWDPPYQHEVKQNTTAFAAATQAEANLVLNNITLIKSIISNGPNVAPSKRPIYYNTAATANISNAAKIILANKDYIKAETIAFVNAVIFDPPYQSAVKQNTTAFAAASIAEANIVLNNINLITNIIEYGANSAPTKRPISYSTLSNNTNVINAAKIILANRDYIKAEVKGYINQNWSNIASGLTYYTVANATPLVGNTSTVILLETVNDVTFLPNIAVSFHQPSYISGSGHTFEYVGSGTDLARALPYQGGFPIQENEVVQERGGQVYFTSTDQQGDFRIGSQLLFNRVDGTITGETFNKSLFAVMTPYILAIEG